MYISVAQLGKKYCMKSTGNLIKENKRLPFPTDRLYDMSLPEPKTSNKELTAHPPASMRKRLQANAKGQKPKVSKHVNPRLTTCKNHF